MKKTLLLLLLLAPSLLHAQLTMRDVLSQMPDTLVPYLSRDNRLDLLDYLDAKMTPEVTNELQGKTRLTAFGPDSLLLHMNSSHKLTVYLMDTTQPVDSSTQVIALIHTYRLSTGQEEHTTQFYSHHWKPLQQMPQLSTEQRARLHRPASTLLRRDDDVMSAQPVARR